MLLMGYLLTRSSFWEHAKLRVLVEVQNNNVEATKQELQLELEQARITAEAIIVENCSVESIVNSSADASLVFLQLTLKEGQIVDCDGELADKLLPQLPLVALVVAAQQIDLDAEPETGTAGLFADAEDSLAAAQKRHDVAEKEVQDLNSAIEETLQDLLKSRQQGDETASEKLYKHLASLRQQLDKATRRSAKADTKHDQEKQRLEKLRHKFHLNDPTSENPNE